MKECSANQNKMNRQGVGDSSVVEPTPQGTASTERLWVQIPLSPLAGPLCHRCAPTCLETESNLAPNIKALYFLVHERGDRLAILTYITYIGMFHITLPFSPLQALLLLPYY